MERQEVYDAERWFALADRYSDPDHHSSLPAVLIAI
jgi:hypothetical protein